MFIIDFIPNSLFYIIAAISVLAIIASKFIPVPSLYIKPIAIALLAGSIYFIGAHANDEHWQQKVLEAEQKVQQLQLEAEELNTKLVAEQGKKRETIIKRQQASIRFIEKEIIRYDKSCVIPKEFIDVLNKSAERPQ